AAAAGGGGQGGPVPRRPAPRGLHRHAPDLHPDGSEASDADPRGPGLRRGGTQGARSRHRLRVRQRVVVRPAAVPPGEGVQGPVQGGHRTRPAGGKRHGVRGGWWSTRLPSPQVKEFKDRYKAATGTDPQWYNAMGYETVRALLAAIS